MASDDLVERLETAVRDRLVALLGEDDAGLGLAGRVYADIWPAEAQSLLPCLFLLTEDAEEDAGGDTEHRLTWLTVRCFLAAREGARRAERRHQYRQLRKRLTDAFRNRRQPDSADCREVQWCEVRYQKVFDQNLPHYQYLASGWSYRFLVREAR